MPEATEQFHPDEILQIAIDIEENGVAFYRQAAERTDASAARDLFLELADWEARHEQTFAGMREKFDSGRDAEIRLDPDGIAARYLKSIADGKIFTDRSRTASELLRACDSPGAILEKAIELEKESVLFYLNLREAVPERLDPAEVDRIVREEVWHVLYLGDKLVELRQQPES